MFCVINDGLLGRFEGEWFIPMRISKEVSNGNAWLVLLSIVLYHSNDLIDHFGLQRIVSAIPTCLVKRST